MMPLKLGNWPANVLEIRKKHNIWLQELKDSWVGSRTHVQRGNGRITPYVMWTIDYIQRCISHNRNLWLKLERWRNQNLKSCKSAHIYEYEQIQYQAKLVLCITLTVQATARSDISI